jgi:DNA-binding FrmR family transcriptional regulator
MAKPRELPMYDGDLQQTATARLRRIEGQVRGIARMLDEQRPCMEVLEQIASVQAALRGVGKTVLRNYLQRCATQAIRAGDDSVYDELMDAIYKFAR